MYSYVWVSASALRVLAWAATKPKFRIVDMRCIQFVRDMVDNVRYGCWGCNRSNMRMFNTQFSAYMLPRVTYLIDHMDVGGTNVPDLLDPVSGNSIGTMSVDEWRNVLLDIQFALQYDTTGINLPRGNNWDTEEYLDIEMPKIRRFSLGMRQLGLYYSYLWN